jgi:hypothetical protein
MGLHDFIALFEIMSCLQTLGKWLISNWFNHGVHGGRFSLWQMLVEVSLLEVYLLGDELLLSEFVGTVSFTIVLGVGKGCLCLPVGI